MTLDQAIEKLDREIGNLVDRQTLLREGVTELQIEYLGREFALLAHALYLNRNEPLFRIVRASRKGCTGQ